MILRRIVHRFGPRTLSAGGSSFAGFTVAPLSKRVRSFCAMESPQEMTAATQEKERQKFHNNFENVRIETSLPNPCWSEEMVTQYEKYSKLAEQGIWTKKPSYFDSTGKNRLFPRCLPPEGNMFEYACFLNKDNNLMHSIIQFGPWLQGPKGYVHGGAIATAFDSLMGKHLHEVGYATATMNLNVNFKKPLPIGTVAIAETKIEGRDGRKISSSGTLRTVDNSIVFDTATGLWFDFKWTEKK